MVEQSAGIGIPGFETGNYSGLPVRYRMEIADAYFAPNTESRDPEMVQLQVKGPVTNVVYEEDNEEPVSEGHILYSVGKKERSFDQGATIQREGGSTKIDMNTFYGRFLARMSTLNWSGQSVLEVLKARGGGARIAKTYVGLVMDFERTEMVFGTDREGKQIVAVRMMPVAVVAVPGQAAAQYFAPQQATTVPAIPDQNGYHWNGSVWEPIAAPVPPPVPAPPAPAQWIQSPEQVAAAWTPAPPQIPAAPLAPAPAPVPPPPAPAPVAPQIPAAPGAGGGPQAPQHTNGLDAAIYAQLRQAAHDIVRSGADQPEYRFLDWCYKNFAGNEEVTKRAMDFSFFKTLVS